MPRGEEREVQVFNMSFLDVFCCTVGALIFILFVQILRTRDMVERQELERTMSQLTKVRKELGDTEKAQEAMLAQYQTLRKEVAAAIEERDRIEQEKDSLEEQVSLLTADALKMSEKMELLQKEIAAATEERDRLQQDKGKLEGQVFSLTDDVSQMGEQIETLTDLLAQGEDEADSQASTSMKNSQYSQVVIDEDVAERLSSNYEAKVITCTPDKIYLGKSRVGIPISDRPKFEAALKHFMAYYNVKTEHLWWRQLGDSHFTYGAARALVQASRPEWGRGLVVDRQEESLPDISKAENGVLNIDKDSDGKVEVKYMDTDGDGEWDKKITYISMLPAGVRYTSYDDLRKKWKVMDVDTDGDKLFDLKFKDVDTSDDDWEVMYTYPGYVNRLIESQSNAKYEDTDKDGMFDEKRINMDPNSTIWDAMYTDFNDVYKRWGTLKIDTGMATGKYEIKLEDLNMQNDSWEKKLIDLDGDNIWDERWIDEDDSDYDWEVVYKKGYKNKKDNLTYFEIKLRDTNGDGKWDQRYHDLDHDNTYDMLLKDTNRDGKWDEKWLGTTPWRGWSKKLIDTNGDGKWDKQWLNTEKSKGWEKEFNWDESKGDFVPVK